MRECGECVSLYSIFTFYFHDRRGMLGTHVDQTMSHIATEAGGGSLRSLRSLRLKTNISDALFLTAEIAENAEKKALFVFFVAKTMAPRFAWAGGAAASRPCVDGEAAVPPPASSPFLPRKTQKTTKSGDVGTIL